MRSCVDTDISVGFIDNTSLAKVKLPPVAPGSWASSKVNINPLNPRNDQDLISPYSNNAESFTKIMRIKEMIAILKSIDY